MFKRIIFPFSFIGLIGSFHFFCPEPSSAKIFYRSTILSLINVNKREISEFLEDDFKRDTYN